MCEYRISLASLIIDVKPKNTIMIEPTPRYMFFTGKGGVSTTTLACARDLVNLSKILLCLNMLLREKVNQNNAEPAKGIDSPTEV